MRKVIPPIKLAVALTALMILLSACSLFTGRSRKIGLIELYGSQPVQVQVPEEIERGRDFQISVTTYGGGCVEKGETHVDISALEAVVTPYDYEQTRGACTTELLPYEHVRTVRFEQTGTATVVIRGRSEPAEGVITVERIVNVR